MPIQPTISEKCNKNYLAKIFLMQERNIKKHPNADRLSIVEVDFMPVISNNPVANQWYVFFPTECQINSDYLSHTNSYRDKELNLNPEATPGFFEKNGRVKTVKLRGEYSTGYITPLSSVEEFIGQEIEKKEVYFDMLDVLQFVKKYRKPFADRGEVNGQPRTKSDKKSAKLNVVEGQFQFHEDTENLRKNMFMLYPEDVINVSFKYHGTSAIHGNLLHEKTVKAKWYQKLVGVKDRVEQYYDYIASSRKVIKSDPNLKDTGYYKEDIWSHVLQEIKDRIPKGWTIYSEIVGYLPSGAMIQKDYDYGYDSGTYGVIPYRITVTNPDGDEVELSPEQIIEWSKKNGLVPMHSYFTGTVKDHYDYLLSKHFSEKAAKAFVDVNEIKNNEGIYSEEYKEALTEFRAQYLHMLEAEYNEKDCPICINKVPEEGIIIRKLKHPSKFEALKLKSKAFLLKESKEADKGTVDIEEEQSGNII